MTHTGNYNGQATWVVILSGKRRQHRTIQAIAFEIVAARSGSAAIEKAYPEGHPLLSTKRVTHAIAFQLAEPRTQILRKLHVKHPEWGAGSAWTP